jgi:hypothetical protein
MTINAGSLLVRMLHLVEDVMLQPRPQLGGGVEGGQLHHQYQREEDGMAHQERSPVVSIVFIYLDF